MSENINQSLFNEFFELSLVDYAEMLINTKNLNKNKKSVAEIEYRISNLIKDKIKEMSNKEKKNKSAGETLKIIEKIIDYNKGAQKAFALASKADKGKSEPKPEKSVAKRVILRRGKVAKIKREGKNMNNKFFKEYFTIY